VLELVFKRGLDLLELGNAHLRRRLGAEIRGIDPARGAARFADVGDVAIALQHLELGAGRHDLDDGAVGIAAFVDADQQLVDDIDRVGRRGVAAGEHQQGRQ
jgi:hypothetical protein